VVETDECPNRAIYAIRTRPSSEYFHFLPDLARRDLEDLLEVSRLPGSMRANLRQELARREKI